MPVTREHLGEWLDAYFAAWRSNEAADVEALFAPDAVYSYGPFREPALGVWPWRRDRCAATA